MLAGGRSAAAAVAVSADGRWVASGDATGTIRLWRSGTRAAPRLLRLHDRPVSGLAFDARATRLASSADDGRVVLWSLPSGRPVVLSRRADSAFDVAFAPDGRDVVVAGEGGYLAVIGTGGRHAATLLRGHRGAVLSATFSPDGRRIASTGADGTTRLWRRDGEPLATLRGHEGQVESVGFRRDGERLVTAGLDGTVRVWDPAQPEALAILRALGRRSFVAQFSPDGRRVLATVLDDAVWIMPCEVCGSLRDVLALARARAARQLTAEERRRFLAGAP